MIVGLVIGMMTVGVVTAGAQDVPGPFVSGSVAAAVDGGAGRQSLQGAVGYRFNQFLGMEIDTTWMELTPTSPNDSASAGLSFAYSNKRTEGYVLTPSLRLEMPTPSRRVRTHVVVGAGIVKTRNSYTVGIGYLSVPTPGAPQVNEAITNASVWDTTLGATYGGGISFFATDHVALDIDLRSFYLRGNPIGASGGAVGRFGIGTSYRFCSAHGEPVLLPI